MTSATGFFATEISIGKMKITKAAISAFVSCLVVGLSMIITGIFTGMHEATAAGIYSIVMAPLATYIINCIVVGKCLRLASALAIAYILFAIMGAILTALLLAKKTSSMTSTRSRSRSGRS